LVCPNFCLSICLCVNGPRRRPPKKLLTHLSPKGKHPEIDHSNHSQSFGFHILYIQDKLCSFHHGWSRIGPAITTQRFGGLCRPPTACQVPREDSRRMGSWASRKRALDCQQTLQPVIYSLLFCRTLVSNILIYNAMAIISFS
jgi:hypothetical protein